MLLAVMHSCTLKSRLPTMPLQRSLQGRLWPQPYLHPFRCLTYNNL